MLTVGALHERVQAGIALDELESELGRWILVGAPSEESDDWSFRTESNRIIRVASSGGLHLALQDDFVVHTLKKDPARPFANTVLIGRAASNDVVLNHASVSKLHARLLFDGERWSLSDAASSNGTMIDNDSVEPDVRTPIDGDVLVQFGSCALYLMTTERLFTVLG